MAVAGAVATKDVPTPNSPIGRNPNWAGVAALVAALELQRFEHLDEELLVRETLLLH